MSKWSGSFRISEITTRVEPRILRPLQLLKLQGTLCVYKQSQVQENEHYACINASIFLHVTLLIHKTGNRKGEES